MGWWSRSNLKIQYRYMQYMYFESSRLNLRFVATGFNSHAFKFDNDSVSASLRKIFCHIFCGWRILISREFFCFCFLFYLPFLSSIREKANCIAILWAVSPHSLGSCLSRGLWATCLQHKGGGIPLSALPKDTTSELAGLFSTTSHKCRAPSREAIDTIF